MTCKGRRAQRTLAGHAESLKVTKRQVPVTGRGIDPCPEPETRAVLTSSATGNNQLGYVPFYASGIVTRKGEDCTGFVSKANRARPVRETPTLASTNTSKTAFTDARLTGQTQSKTVEKKEETI